MPERNKDNKRRKDEEILWTSSSRFYFIMLCGCIRKAICILLLLKKGQKDKELSTSHAWIANAIHKYNAFAEYHWVLKRNFSEDSDDGKFGLVWGFEKKREN